MLGRLGVCHVALYLVFPRFFVWFLEISLLYRLLCSGRRETVGFLLHACRAATQLHAD
jgi:hypothetical protein